MTRAVGGLRADERGVGLHPSSHLRHPRRVCKFAIIAGDAPSSNPALTRPL